MGINSLCRGAFLGFWVVLLVATGFCHGDDKAVLEVVGIGECADCAVNNIETSQAFSGLKVTIDCKSEKGELKTRAAGELDKQGKFELSLPEDILENGKLKQECWAQLHSASATPCPAYNGLDSSKIVFKSKSAGKHTFTTAGKLKFSPATCISAFFWPYHKHPLLPKSHPLFKYFHHPYHSPKPVPVYKPPVTLPPHVPIYKPKPTPTPVPIYKPKPKPTPTPIPIYKPKPTPTPVPIYKPKPKPLPPTVPVYKPKPKPEPKPLPPSVPVVTPKTPVPIYKKPCPPFPKIPIPKIPPKYFHHPKYGSLIPPYSPHPYFHHPKYGSLVPPYSPHPFFHHPKYGSLVPPIPPYHHP
ncbi:Proline-rich protein [Actinidia chinensis var. chinensis]|uniref:Proline-rich protein n=1 Tax=Actinidia chinensis var. chinensis TaxID=1590841 RepID=A0A2R6R6V6_ACTCC|nr:Proline-rich protein [Actinidia chinensis var. chinensis]